MLSRQHRDNLDAIPIDECQHCSGGVCPYLGGDCPLSAETRMALKESGRKLQQTLRSPSLNKAEAVAGKIRALNDANHFVEMFMRVLGVHPS